MLYSILMSIFLGDRRNIRSSMRLYRRRARSAAAPPHQPMEIGGNLYPASSSTQVEDADQTDPTDRTWPLLIAQVLPSAILLQRFFLQRPFVQRPFATTSPRHLSYEYIILLQEPHGDINTVKLSLANCASPLFPSGTLVAKNVGAKYRGLLVLYLGKNLREANHFPSKIIFE
jgi:hypothetical protein